MEKTDKPYALFDIDDSMYDGLSLIPLMNWQVSNGIITPESLWESEFARVGYREDRGNFQHENATQTLLQLYAQALKGARYSDVQSSTNEFYKQTNGFYDFVAPTVEALSKTHDIAIVTGEPQFIAEAVKNRFSIETSFSSEYEVDEGFVTGAITSYLATRHEKREAIAPFVNSRRYEGSFAFGDSDNDTEILKAAEHAVCIKPNARLNITKKAHEIMHRDLIALGVSPYDMSVVVKPHDWTIIPADQLTSNAVLGVVQKHYDSNQQPDKSV
ncbi:MAG TPA: haloacid dehalogenase-like hydrolase [Candidatus Saccharimonadales bacterium]|nr:haloacid dehalogenase-like hydrolase [Candidatus Saccharimonadales bacterium]